MCRLLRKLAHEMQQRGWVNYNQYSVSVKFKRKFAKGLCHCLRVIGCYKLSGQIILVLKTVPNLNICDFKQNFNIEIWRKSATDATLIKLMNSYSLPQIRFYQRSVIKFTT